MNKISFTFYTLAFVVLVIIDHVYGYARLDRCEVAKWGATKAANIDMKAGIIKTYTAGTTFGANKCTITSSSNNYGANVPLTLTISGTNMNYVFHASKGALSRAGGLQNDGAVNSFNPACFGSSDSFQSQFQVILTSTSNVGDIEISGICGDQTRLLVSNKLVLKFTNDVTAAPSTASPTLAPSNPNTEIPSLALLKLDSDKKFTIQAEPVNNDVVKVILEYKKIGWFSVGLGKEMENSVDLVVLKSTDNNNAAGFGIYQVGNFDSMTLSDAIATDPAVLENDFGIKVLALDFFADSGRAEFEVTLSKQNPKFVLFPSDGSLVDIVWAVGSSNAFFQHNGNGNSRGSLASVSLLNGNGGNNVFNVGVMLFAHFVCMIIAWSILSPIGVIIPLFSNGKHGNKLLPRMFSKWFQYHYTLQYTAFLFSLVGFITAVIYKSGSGSHFGTFHELLGLFVFAGGLIQPLHGYFRPAKGKTGEAKSFGRKFFDFVHPLIGFFCVLGGLVDSFIGALLLTTRGSPAKTFVVENSSITGSLGVASPIGIISLLCLIVFGIAIVMGILSSAHYGAACRKKRDNSTQLALLSPKASKSSLTGDGGFRKISGPIELTSEDVMKHSTPDDCYVIYKNKVYDVTNFLSSHPGGKRVILGVAGRDMTQDFDNNGHSASALAQLAKFCVGVYRDAESPSSTPTGLKKSSDASFRVSTAPPSRPASAMNIQATSNTSRSSVMSMRGAATIRSQVSSIRSQATSAFNRASATIKNTTLVRNASNYGNRRHVLQGPDQKVQVKLASRTKLSHNVIYIRLDFSDSDLILGLPPGKHILVYAADGETNRKYTPIEIQEKGFVHLVVKVYPNGVLGNYLANLDIGEMITIAGPVGSLQYLGSGVFTKNQVPREKVKNVFMLAGGSGITPMYQVIFYVLNDPLDSSVHLTLLYANTTLDDILLKNELFGLVKKFPGRLSLWFTLSKPPTKGWKYSTGRVTSEMLSTHLVGGVENHVDSILLICGPEGLVETAEKELDGIYPRSKTVIL